MRTNLKKKLRPLILLSAFLVVSSPTQARLLPPRTIPSSALGGDRTIRIYLPPSYDSAPQRRYPVLYLHDGQNVFSSAGPGVAFGWGNWELDLTADRLVAENKMREIIMVAIDNSPMRYQEYRGPARDWSEAERRNSRRRIIDPGDNTRYEAYRRFLIDELKPRLDGEFRTLTNAANTGVLGSSMGGICSLALAWDRPDVFGLAASISGAYQVENRWFLDGVLKPYRGKRKSFRVYLDSGTASPGRGDDGAEDTRRVADALQRIGWTPGLNLLHFVDEKPMTEAALTPFYLAPDKLAEAQKSQHNELYWRLRAWRALVFLFPPSGSRGSHP